MSGVAHASEVRPSSDAREVDVRRAREPRASTRVRRDTDGAPLEFEAQRRVVAACIAAELATVDPVTADVGAAIRHRAACAAMATRFELVLEGASRRALTSAAEAAVAEIEACAARWSVFRRDGLPARIARAPAGERVRIDRDDLELLAIALECWHATEHAFDPALAVRLRGRVARDADALERADAAAGCGDLELDVASCSARTRRGGVGLDLGGIAKGHALELAARALREHGVERAFLHGGTSSVLALGAPRGARGWCVAVGPRRVWLADAALSVSAQRAWSAGVASSGCERRSAEPLHSTRCCLQEGYTSNRVDSARDAEMSRAAHMSRSADPLRGATRAHDARASTRTRASSSSDALHPACEPRGSADPGVRRTAHILDPRGGELAQGDALCAAVHRDARVAEAWSTALVVAGPTLFERAAAHQLALLWIPRTSACRAGGVALAAFESAAPPIA